MQVATLALGKWSTSRRKYHGFRLVIEKIADRIACLRAADDVVASTMGNARHYYVSGIVQGVGYRFFVERAAKRLKLGGYVRNLSDGRVEVYAIGDDASLQALRAELARGPSGASVAHLTEEAAALDSRYENSFWIDYDA